MDIGILYSQKSAIRGFHWHFHKTCWVLNSNEHIFCKSKKKGHKRVEESFSISSIDDTTMLLHFFQTPKIPGTFSDFLIQLEATTIEYTMSNVEWYSRPPHAAPCAPRLSAASPRPCCCNAARARRYIRKQLMKIPSRIQIAIV